MQRLISIPTRRKGGARRVISITGRDNSNRIVTPPIYGHDSRAIHEAGVELLMNGHSNKLNRAIFASTDGVRCTICGGFLDEIQVCGRCQTDHFELLTGGQ